MCNIVEIFYWMKILLNNKLSAKKKKKRLPKVLCSFLRLFLKLWFICTLRRLCGHLPVCHTLPIYYFLGTTEYPLVMWCHFFSSGNKIIKSHEATTKMHSVTNFKNLNSSHLTPCSWDPKMTQNCLDHTKKVNLRLGKH